MSAVCNVYCNLRVYLWLCHVVAESDDVNAGVTVQGNDHVAKLDRLRRIIISFEDESGEGDEGDSGERSENVEGSEGEGERVMRLVKQMELWEGGGDDGGGDGGEE